ncbi:MAG TPA: hypothetical protein VGL83_05155 [Stellaceae bacterium]|jgi:hypothetical protein
MTASRGSKILCAAILFAGVAAPASTALAAPVPPLANLDLSCSDFTHNQDGSWNPAHPIAIAGMVINVISSFHAGDTIGGVDLGAILDRDCRNPK